MKTMKTKKAKFEPFSLVVSTRKELRLLHVLLHQLDRRTCSDLVGMPDINVDLFYQVNAEMDNQEVRPVSKDIIFTVYD